MKSSPVYKRLFTKEPDTFQEVTPIILKFYSTQRLPAAMNFKVTAVRRRTSFVNYVSKPGLLCCCLNRPSLTITSKNLIRKYILSNCVDLAVVFIYK
jgi:hypothetical protein